ncbi:hypothetical protein SISNIDRAFT_448954 [Sistotremastrum niveocremeum HHB9708]|uniref:Uncharacterized protein n=2 Tax=Sistotremastraceae TaxID=3402574 RepID=A0A165A9J4_9AGAM|nr:hypothetical protein SISNIDRAFT_448954 [Sistotremastrum niveocremeum HHB9708]KZT42507.1 hypothetical protein SISSUDRAFT_1125661 [Sistotremastrum suecicum HHB10207 ss-3]
MSLFETIFGCCLRRSSSNGERDRLISSDLEAPAAYTHLAPPVDHVKERLGRIVRAKESSMVNASRNMPFNLHHSSDQPSWSRGSSSRYRAASPEPSISASMSESSESIRRSHSQTHMSNAEESPEPRRNVRVIRGVGVIRKVSRDEAYLRPNGNGLGDETPPQQGEDGNGNAVEGDTVEVSELPEADRERILALSSDISKRLREGQSIPALSTANISRGWDD